MTREESKLKLFAFQPKGHGDPSFFVMAETEEEARQAIGAKMTDIEKEYDEDYKPYVLTVAGRGEVIENAND